MLFEGFIHDFKAWLPWNRHHREKRAMRAIIEQRRRVMSAQDVTKASTAIIKQIEMMSSFQKAKTVLLYYPVHNEVDLRPLLEKYRYEKTMLLPVTHRHWLEVRPYDGEDMMRRGHYGVPEPQTAEYTGKIDMTRQIGVCYDFQYKHHEIPHDWFDHKVDAIVTPTRYIG